MLTWTADRYPGRLAVGGPRPLTWRQWDARTNQLARALAARGVRPGDRVVYLLAGGEPMASLHLAVQKLGAAAVPLSTRFGPSELAYCVRDAEPSMVIGDDTTSASLAAALPDGPPVRARDELDSWPRTSRTASSPEPRIRKTSASSCTPRVPPAARRASRAPTGPSTPPPSPTSSRPSTARAR